MHLSATGNHKNIANALGYNIKEYRYWDAAARKFDVDGMIEDLRVGIVSEPTANKLKTTHSCCSHPMTCL